MLNKKTKRYYISTRDQVTFAVFVTKMRKTSHVSGQKPRQHMVVFVSVLLSPLFCLPVLLDSHFVDSLEFKVLQGAKSDTRCFHGLTVAVDGFKKCALVNLNYTPE